MSCILSYLWREAGLGNWDIARTFLLTKQQSGEDVHIIYSSLQTMVPGVLNALKLFQNVNPIGYNSKTCRLKEPVGRTISKMVTTRLMKSIC
jgi:hypothetical protein